ncbi:MAG: hypothetical protein JO332_09625 [Planctomycetaceae bacterium]|nr:hypothetical protein [Planctomycetaceae bacterium]
MSLPEFPPLPIPPTHQERNALILRRTLSAISWIYGFWSALFAAMALLAKLPTQGLYDPRFILGHAALLTLAGILTWKPRRGAVAVVALAAAGSVFFVGLDLQRGQIETALLDGAYVPLAVLLLVKSRAAA